MTPSPPEPAPQPRRQPVRASEHFIPLERLPQIDVGTLLRCSGM